MRRVFVSQAVSASMLIKKVPAQYPQLAQLARIQGQVVLDAVIDRNGVVETLVLLSGHPMLAPAAIEAVRHWIYNPYLVNGQPVEMETEITVSF